MHTQGGGGVSALVQGGGVGRVLNRRRLCTFFFAVDSIACDLTMFVTAGIERSKQMVCLTALRARKVSAMTHALEAAAWLVMAGMNGNDDDDGDGVADNRKKQRVDSDML